MEVLNSAGKEVFLISDKDRFYRFLNLGSNQNCLNAFVTESYTDNLKKGEFDYLYNIIDKNPESFLSVLHVCITNQVCKKQDPLLFSLAIGATYKSKSNTSLSFRKKVYSMIHECCHTPTQLNIFLDYCKKVSLFKNNSSCWNNTHKKAILHWYNRCPSTKIIYQITKYGQRNGYDHRDVFRLLHPRPKTKAQDIIYHYVIKTKIKGIDSVNPSANTQNDKEKEEIEEEKEARQVRDFLEAYEKVKNGSESVEEVCEMIKQHNFSREHLPTSFLSETLVWETLLPHMQPIALLRNLNKLTSIGLLDKDEVKDQILEKLRNIKGVHPLQILVCIKIYAQGNGNKGSLCWVPDQDILRILNEKFLDVHPLEIQNDKGKILCALDVSGSMHTYKVFGAECLSAAELVIAYAMILKKQYGEHLDLMCFSERFLPLNVSPHKSLEDNLHSIRNIHFGSTDISVPFLWSLDKKRAYSNFIVMTDNETNMNKIRPSDALKKYRTEMNIPDAGLLVIATSSCNFTVADPNDSRMLDICGFNDVVPKLIQEFCA